MDLLKKAIILILFLFSLIIAMRVFFLGRYPDFSVYYFGTKAFLTGINPYFPTSDSFSNYVYPPFVLLFFIPLVALPLSVASIIFVLVSFTSLFLGVYFCLKTLKKFTLTSYLLALSLSLVAFPTKFTLGMGQINLIIFFLLSFSLYLLSKNKQVSAGSLIGLSFAVKLFPLFLLVYFLLQKRLKVFLISLGILLFLYGLTVIIVGVPLNKLFINSVLPGVANAYQSEYYNQALSGFFARLPLETGFGIIIKNVISFLFVFISFFLIYKARKRKSTQHLSFSFVITLSLLVNPFSWQHHFVWLILPFIVTFYYITDRIIDYIVLGLSYLLVSLNFAHPQNLPLLIQSHVLFGTILLWFLQARLLVDKK